MTSTTRQDRAIARSLIAVGVASFVTGLALAIIAAAQAGSTPVGPLPAGQDLDDHDGSQSARRCCASARTQAVRARLEASPALRLPYRPSDLRSQRRRQRPRRLQGRRPRKHLACIRANARRRLAQSVQVRYAQDSLRLTGRQCSLIGGCRSALTGAGAVRTSYRRSPVTERSAGFGIFWLVLRVDAELP
jgi:hypothetical protein